MAEMRFPKGTPIETFQCLSELVADWLPAGWSQCLFLVDYVEKDKISLLKGHLSVNAHGELTMDNGDYKTKRSLIPGGIRSLMRLPPKYKNLDLTKLLKTGEWLLKDDEIETRIFLAAMQ